ncbi:hypothetical protein AMTRI_Chr02g253920 [Amborella trichopoda]|uniref:FAD dependent oxidoreductase domain-containing protein n=1 Tax=Amborella trichopoda TaxID=13333 RepID=W1NQR9_AMBTC|nr:putative oxidoreductase TDA3 [Amborella trichopoda]ERM99286.1 hypothetical protein AMTR_s00092p00163760 [Amborella trichopoda]|eukprot:XP_006836433.3 putative oxidoreductase TDA3 [Amborella trichopoda]
MATTPAPSMHHLTRAMASDAAGAGARRILVCGGGVIGICTAFFLAKKGASVGLVEKSAIACAASGKAGGFLALDWCDGSPLGPLARASFRLHQTLAQELDGPRAYGYRPLNALSLTFSEQPNAYKVVAGGVSPWIDGPVRRLSTIGTPETTAQVHPKLFSETLLRAARDRYGVEVVMGEVESVEVEGGRVRGVLVGGELLPADAVVLALGPWSNRLPLLSSIFRVSGVKAHSIVLEPHDPKAITPHALFLRYITAQGVEIDPEVYPRPTGEVYVCGMSETTEVPDDPQQITPKEESVAMLHRVAATVSSHLRGAQVKEEQACFLPCSEDGHPIIGRVPNVGGVYVATAHSCWGILNGPATGAALAELILEGRASIVDLEPFNPGRFI